MNDVLLEKSVDSSSQKETVDSLLQECYPYENSRPRCPHCRKSNRSESWGYAFLMKVAYVRQKSTWKKVGLYCENCGLFVKT